MSSSVATLVINSPIERRNPYVSKWNLLFDSNVKEWISFKPKVGLQVYPCYACRHIFGSKNSFLDHVNRRSIYIKYNCRICSPQERLIFYNPCSFLIHARRHFSFIQGVIDLNDLEINPLPLGLAGFMPHPAVKMLYDVEDDDARNININSRFYTTSSECMGHRMIFFTPTEVFFFCSANANESLSTLVLKQISTNIPRCVLVEVDHNSLMHQPLLSESVPLNVNINTDNQNECNEDSISHSNSVVNAALSNGTIKLEPADDETDENQTSTGFEYTMPIITKVETVIESESTENSPSKTSKEQSSEFNYPSCPECNSIQKNPMVKHFLEDNKPFNTCMQCSTCKYIAPTMCSLKAHQRIHDTQPPFVCPECGKSFSSWKTFNTHLNDVCFHLAKQVRTKCPGKKCGKVFAQQATFTTHFISSHLQCLNKCSICKAAFFSEKEFLEHTEKHQNTETPEKIYNCTVCLSEKTFKEGVLEEHVQMHASDRINFLYVYVCKHCKSYFRSNLTYATHLLRCTKNSSNMPSEQKNKEVRVSSENKKNCEQLSSNSQRAASCTSKTNEEKTDVKMHSVITICSKCNTRLQLKVTNLKNMLVNCPKCSEKLYLAAKSLNFQGNHWKGEPIAAHNINISGIEDPELIQNEDSNEERCILCQLIVTDENEHRKTCKYRFPMVRLHKLSFPESGRESSTSPKSDDSNKKKRKRYNYTALTNKHKKLLAAENFPELQAEEPMPFDGTYHCKLCQFYHEDRSEFHNHIITHRLVSTSYQCMECGECFVVKPSLAKHLQFYHQIFDVEDYLKENNCYDKEAVKELTENMKLAPGEHKTPVKDNQCRVCLQEFQNESDLSKHFRVHGMAFLLHMK